MSRGRTWLTLAARVLSVVLMISAGFAFLTAVLSFFTLGPESGAVGVVMVDALFGAFILFIAARFLWIYAVKSERLRELEE